MANNEGMQLKIDTLTARVQELERALQDAQRNTSHPNDPMLEDSPTSPSSAGPSSVENGSDRESHDPYGKSRVTVVSTFSDEIYRYTIFGSRWRREVFRFNRALGLLGTCTCRRFYTFPPPRLNEWDDIRLPTPTDPSHLSSQKFQRPSWTLQHFTTPYLRGTLMK